MGCAPSVRRSDFVKASGLSRLVAARAGVAVIGGVWTALVAALGT